MKTVKRKADTVRCVLPHPFCDVGSEYNVLSIYSQGDEIKAIEIGNENHSLYIEEHNLERFEWVEDEPAIPPHSTAATEEVALNPILREIHWKIVSQTEKGLKKYGKPVHPDNHSLTEWIDHAVEESIDHITYLLMIKKKIEEGAE